MVKNQLHLRHEFNLFKKHILNRKEMNYFTNLNNEFEVFSTE